MRVHELISQLEKYDRDTRVVVPGYEGGVNDVENVKFVNIATNVNEEWYYGSHEIVDPEKGDDIAILIS